MSTQTHDVSFLYRQKAAFYFKLSLLIALVIHIAAFWVIPNFEPTPYEVEELEKPAEVIDVVEMFSEPEKPQATIETKLDVSEIEIGADDIDEDLTIEETTVDPYEEPEIEVHDSGFVPPFVAFDSPAEVRRSTPAPKYPDIARKVGLEGQVVLMVQVGVDGRAKDIKVTKSLQPGIGGCDDEAIKAVKKWKFKPAEQNGQPVEVWTQVIVTFSLNKTE